jgi:hypothetical protein
MDCHSAFLNLHGTFMVICMYYSQFITSIFNIQYVLFTIHIIPFAPLCFLLLLSLLVCHRKNSKVKMPSTHLSISSLWLASSFNDNKAEFTIVNNDAAYIHSGCSYAKNGAFPVSWLRATAGQWPITTSRLLVLNNAAKLLGRGLMWERV